MRYHGTPSAIMPDRGIQFTSKLRQSMKQALRTKHALSLSYHLQMDGDTKRLNQVLEDMPHVTSRVSSHE